MDRLVPREVNTIGNDNASNLRQIFACFLYLYIKDDS